MMTNDDLYYVLTSDVSRTTARFSSEPEVPDGADLWIDGVALTAKIPRPIVFDIEPGDEGEMGAIIETAIPLMSESLLETLQECGVDNLEIYEAVINELGTGEKHTNYRAVNVLGVIDAIDRSKSAVTSLEGLGTWVDNMVLDEKVARGALMFRLRQSLSKVIVHKRVKEAIESELLPLVCFQRINGLSG